MMRDRDQLTLVSDEARFVRIHAERVRRQVQQTRVQCQTGLEMARQSSAQLREFLRDLKAAND